MAQISALEADALLSKLLTEKVPLLVFFKSRSLEVNLPGFVDSKTEADGVCFSVSGPPIDVSKGFLRVVGFNRPCDFWYGEQRELSEDRRVEAAARALGESVLMI